MLVCFWPFSLAVYKFEPTRDVAAFAGPALHLCFACPAPVVLFSDFRYLCHLARGAVVTVVELFPVEPPVECHNCAVGTVCAQISLLKPCPAWFEPQPSVSLNGDVWSIGGGISTCPWPSWHPRTQTCGFRDCGASPSPQPGGSAASSRLSRPLVRALWVEADKAPSRWR